MAPVWARSLTDAKATAKARRANCDDVDHLPSLHHFFRIPSVVLFEQGALDTAAHNEHNTPQAKVLNLF